VTTANEDIMPTLAGDVHVEGWDHMVDKHKTRAAILQALVNLEIEAYTQGGILPTQIAILERVRKDGLQTKDSHIEIKLSKTSQKEVNRHINSHLIPDGYIVTRTDHEKPKRGRGGPAAPWQSVIVSRLIRKKLTE
jgi:hypothetical protein